MSATAAAAVSIGNYKGVMLCNRPFVSSGGGVSSMNPKAGGPKQTFMCGNVSSELGTNVPISSKERTAQSEIRSRKETALQKHRKWLEELQRTKEQFEIQFNDESNKKKERQERFMRREAKMRALIRKTRQRAAAAAAGAKARSETIFIVKDDKERPQHPETDDHDAVLDEQSQDMNLPDRAEAKDEDDKISHDQLRRPMWALTSKQAEDATDLIENEEADDLLEFAQALDYEKYIQDAEVSGLIENVRARIRDLECSQHQENKFEDDTQSEIDHQLGDQVKAMKLTMANLQALGSPTTSDESKRADDACSVVASSVLGSEDGKRLGNIHSKKSLMAVAERSKNALTTVAEEKIDEETLPQPRIVHHTNHDVRIEAKSDASNLPYLHRNPAV